MAHALMRLLADWQSSGAYVVRESAKQFLRENPKVADAIEKKIREQSSIISEALMVADTGEGEADVDAEAAD